MKIDSLYKKVCDCHYTLVYTLHRACGAFYRFRLPPRRMRFQSSLIRDKSRREENVLFTLKIKRLHFSLNDPPPSIFDAYESELQFSQIISAKGKAQSHSRERLFYYLQSSLAHETALSHFSWEIYRLLQITRSYNSSRSCFVASNINRAKRLYLNKLLWAVVI